MAVDEKYYQAIRPGSLGERVAIRARDQIYADFLRLCRPTPQSRVLDLGVSDVVGDAANVLERCYPYPAQITAVGLGEGGDFRAAFPAVTYRQITPGAPLPFPDGAFDIATSNAVLEHVGSRAAQHFFVSDLCRVAKHVFITVPNKFFPVEHHTGIPLLHWWQPAFNWGARLLGRHEWANEKNLIFMTRASLHGLCPQDRKCEIGYTGIKLGPFSANLYLNLQDAKK